MKLAILDQIPTQLIQFVLTVVFSLLIGMEQHRHHTRENFKITYGTDRTFTLMGVLGYVLWIIMPGNLAPFLLGASALIVFLAIFYLRKIDQHQKFGITTLISGLITYCLGPLIITQPQWLVLMLVVTLLVITEIKDDLMAFSKKFDNNEFVTLAKFMTLAGVILPLLPNKPISAEFAFSPYQFWLSIVVVSAISYFSYLLQKFAFPHAGLLLTGVLGGLYSSTATTIILARKSHTEPGNSRVVPAIMLSMAMMYLRIYLLSFIFSHNVASLLLPWFAILFVISCSSAWLLLRFHGQINPGAETTPTETALPQRNPLEFKTAFVFGLLFVVFALVTHYVLSTFGKQGLHGMALIVGVTDIDPFILNLLQGKWKIPPETVGSAILLAINSNNIAKLVYALILGQKEMRRNLIIGMGALILSGFFLAM
ncbi:MAG: MgtC/SapB family protein [Bacteroidetes bacterium]|nr:MgtC/SapB family protein [Bacteroidota bacterium]